MNSSLSCKRFGTYIVDDRWLNRYLDMRLLFLLTPVTHST
jgi:hypothetical protein